MDEMVIRRLVAAASGVVYWGGVLIQARRVRRHIGRSPNLKPRTPKERVLWVGWILVILVWILQPILVHSNRDWPDQPIALRLWPANFGVWTVDFALHPAFLFAAIGLVLAGYLGTLWCYSAMGDA